MSSHSRARSCSFLRSPALSAALSALVFAVFATCAQAALDTRLKAAAEQAQPALIASLKDLVMIESGSSDAVGLAKMAAYTEARLQAMGAKIERVKSSVGVGADIVVGRFEGTGKKRVMLMAHMDTVYQPGILSSQPYRTDGNRIYGPGIADDKGGIAVILHSLKILRDSGWRNFATLTVVFNADEEVGSTGSGELIANLADQNDVVLSCEPTAAKSVAKTESLLLGASGTATATMSVKGRASHAGASPELGRNALIELSHQLLQTRGIAETIPGAQLNWTVSKAGLVRNQIPENAEATGDVRTTQNGAAEKLQVALQTKVNASALVPDTVTTITMLIGRPSFVASDKGRALASQAQAIYAELDGRSLQLVPSSGGATDAGFAGRSGKATVVESFGLAGFGYHAKDEYIEVDSIVPRLYLMTRLLTEIGNQ